MSNQDYYYNQQQQQQQQQHSNNAPYTNSPSQPQYSTPQPHGLTNHPYPPQSQQYAAPTGPPPGHASSHSNNDDSGLPQGQERSEQMETLQSYEASAQQTEDDVNQATLQKEFPSIDSSLIAAIYGDSKNLSATREMLHELSSN